MISNVVYALALQGMAAVNSAAGGSAAAATATAGPSGAAPALMGAQRVSMFGRLGNANSSTGGNPKSWTAVRAAVRVVRALMRSAKCPVASSRVCVCKGVD